MTRFLPRSKINRTKFTCFDVVLRCINWRGGGRAQMIFDLSDRPPWMKPMGALRLSEDTDVKGPVNGPQECQVSALPTRPQVVMATSSIICMSRDPSLKWVQALLVEANSWLWSPLIRTLTVYSKKERQVTVKQRWNIAVLILGANIAVRPCHYTIK